MTTNRKFNSLLLNELQLISNKIDELITKKTQATKDEQDFYNFMIELLELNLVKIQKKLLLRDSDLNKKIVFVSGKGS